MTRTLVWSVRNILVAPLSGANWYEKVVLRPLGVFIGLPLYPLAYCLSLLPLLLGGGFLLRQSYLYLEEGEWHSFSVLDVSRLIPRTGSWQMKSESHCLLPVRGCGIG